MKNLRRILIISTCFVMGNIMNVQAGTSLYNYNTYNYNNNEQYEDNNPIQIDMNNVATLISAINDINNENISNHKYSKTDIQIKTTSSQLLRSTDALRYANEFAEAVNVMSSGDYSENELITCYSSLIKLDDYIKHKDITYNNTLYERAFATIQKFIPLVTYIADNCKDLLEQNNLPVYGSDMYNNKSNTSKKSKKNGFLSRFF